MQDNKKEIIKSFEKTVMQELEKLKQVEDKQEKIEKLNTLFNINKILENYDELEPILIDFFKNQARKNKFKGDNGNYGR